MAAARAPLPASNRMLAWVLAAMPVLIAALAVARHHTVDQFAHAHRPVVRRTQPPRRWSHPRVDPILAGVIL